MLCIIKQNGRYMKKMYDDFVGIDINMEQFQRICNDCWNRTLGFKK